MPYQAWRRGEETERSVQWKEAWVGIPERVRLWGGKVHIFLSAGNCVLTQPCPLDFPTASISILGNHLKLWRLKFVFVLKQVVNKSVM